MVDITLRYTGGLRCEAEHGPSSTQIHTDAPVDNQGRGESFSPTDLVATAVGTCMLTIMGIYAERNQIKLDQSRVVVKKAMTTEGPRRIDQVSLRFELPEVDDRHLEALERAAHACPVARSLAKEVEIDAEFHWGAV